MVGVSLVKLPSGDFNSTSLITALCCQANVDPYLGFHVVSLGRSELKDAISSSTVLNQSIYCAIAYLFSHNSLHGLVYLPCPHCRKTLYRCSKSTIKNHPSLSSIVFPWHQSHIQQFLWLVGIATNHLEANKSRTGRVRFGQSDYLTNK